MKIKRFAGLDALKRQVRKILGEQPNKPVRVWKTSDPDFEPPVVPEYNNWVIVYDEAPLQTLKEYDAENECTDNT